MTSLTIQIMIIITVIINNSSNNSNNNVVNINLSNCAGLDKDQKGESTTLEVLTTSTI